MTLQAPVQVHLRGQSDYLHKLEAASHIFDTWTAKGADAAALADRFLDGSIDMLDEFMTASASCTDEIYHLHKTGDMGCSYYQNRSAGASASGTQHQDKAVVCQAHLPQQGKIAQLQDRTAAPATSNQHQEITAVPVLHKDSLSYQQFVENFMQPNLPVMIQGLTDEWEAAKDWVTPGGEINMDFLAEQFGRARVWASDTTRVNASCAPRLEMTVAEFGEWWRMHKAGKDTRLLYLKDWHFANEFPGYKAYRTPCYFQEDWLNEFCDMKQAAEKAQQRGAVPAATTAAECADSHSGTAAPAAAAARVVSEPERHIDTAASGGAEAGGCADAGPDACSGDHPGTTSTYASSPENSRNQYDVVSSDYRFVYLGCKGTWTPLHADVLRSYSWSTNITGRKHWKLLPPEYTHLLYDRFGREMAATFDLTDSEGRSRFPNLDQACCHVIECVQEPGETIFVPSGWHHTVHNLEDTLSINHNWLNGHNMHWAWALLQQEYTDATAAIEDCREGCSGEEFEGLVQRNMAANCGMDFAFMAHFMHAILHCRQHHTRTCDNCKDLKQHGNCGFDKAKATWVLSRLRSCHDSKTSPDIP